MRHALCLLLVFFSFRTSGQNVTIDYQTWNPSGTACNLFVNPTFVPVTGTISGTIEHQRKLGETVYNSTDQSIQIRTEYQTVGTVYKGGRYRIAYNFKAGYSYMVYITAAAIENTLGFNTGPYIRADINSSSGGGSTGCNGPESLNYNVGGNPAAKVIPSNAFQEFQYIFPQMGNQQTLEITVFPATDGGTKTVRIRKIRIIETAPAPSFTLTPSPVSISCGSTAPITFIATGTNIPNGATVTHNWNLGDTLNGWLYNGSSAPKTITTGSTNTLTLTPICGTTQSNVSASATINNVVYKTNTSNITVTPPPLSIQGPSSICSGSSVYSLIGTLPCNGTVTWTASPAGVVSLSPIGSTVTATQVGSGLATITATINTCNYFSVNKTVEVSIPTVDLVTFSNGVGGQGYFCTSHAGNDFEADFFYPSSNWSLEYRLLSYPNLNVVHTSPYPYSTDMPIPVGSNFTPGWYVLEVMVTNACGSTGWTGFEVEFVNCSQYGSCSECAFSLSASPNPAQGDVTVTIEQEKPEVKALSKSVKVNYVLYDFKRTQIVKQWSFDNRQNQRTLSVRGFGSGQYLLVVTKGKYRQTKQIFIK